MLSMEKQQTDNIGQTQLPSAPDVPCKGISGYRIEREIGHGAQGSVYLAHRETDGQRVAIKRLNIESVKNWKEYELFHREADVLSHLHIDGVARFFEAVDRLDDEPPCSYIVQEYIPGRSLAEMLNAGIRFSLHSVYDIILQILNILKQLQSCTPPVIHRDIKPSNILLEPMEGDRYKVWLIDFGAVANPQVQSGGSTIAGTFGYMPPEQLMGNPVPASDIYALAAVIVYLLSGKSPADMVSEDFYLVFEPELQNLPHAVVQTLRRMLDLKVANRLSDISELMDIWQAFSEDHYSYSVHIKWHAQDMNKDIFEDRLKNVYEYCQPGNMDLWQSLSEKTPRTIPDCYKNVANCYDANISTEGAYIHHIKSLIDTDKNMAVNELPDQTLLLKHTIIEPRSVRRGWLCIFLILLLLLVVILVAVLVEMNGKGKIGAFYPVSLFVISHLIIAVIILMVVPSPQPVGRATIKPSAHSWLNDVGNKKDGSFIRNRYDDLLSRGRKTIATIVSVEYVPADNTYIEEGTKIFSGYTYGNLVADPGRKIVVKDNRGCSFVYHGIPRFRIQYRFNPPDDQKDEDLIHYIDLYGEPDDTCKPGAPLPILYRIRGKEGVDSMPFPIPLAQIADLDCLMYLDRA